MSHRNISVFGGGNAAFAISADLALQGFRVTLCEFPELAHNIEPVLKAGGLLNLGGCGRTGAVRLYKVTTDLQDAIPEADLIVVACQAIGHRELARRIGPFLNPQQIVLLCPGSCFGAFEFHLILHQNGFHSAPKIAETNTFVFAARRTSSNAVQIKHIANRVFLAAFPADETPPIVSELRCLYPSISNASDTLETCLLNLNPYVHSVPAVLNVGRVEYSNGDFFLYREGITPSVARVMAAVDDERIAICRVLGYQETSTQEIFYDAGYTKTLTDDLVADYNSSDVLRTAKGPLDIRYRYYTEDTGVGITVISSLGHTLGLPMPLHDALVNLVSVINQNDYRKHCSRTTENLGIAKLNASQLKSLFTCGEMPMACNE